MTLTRTLFSRLLLCTFTLGACAAAGATGTVSEADAQARYEADVARCKAGQTNQDEATCIQEAGAALEETKRNRLTDKNSNFDQNQVNRCNSLPVAERSDCLQQMSGTNTTTAGSVSGGGVLRETTITVPPGTPGSTTTTPPAGPAMPHAPAVPSTSTPAMPDASTAPSTGAAPTMPGASSEPAAPAMPVAPATPAPGTGVTQ